jgi:hypothetical protein
MADTDHVWKLMKKISIWEAPGATVAYVKMATAALTDNQPDMGETRKAVMR